MSLREIQAEFTTGVFDSFSPKLAAGIVSGGLATLDGLCHRLAALSGRPVRRAAQTEASARGAAWLLTDQTNAWTDADAGERFAPVDDGALRERYRRWRTALAAQIDGGA